MTAPRAPGSVFDVDGMACYPNAYGTPPGKAHFLRNLVPLGGGVLRTRPGFRDTASSYPAEWDAVSPNNPAQWLGGFVKGDGTRFILAIHNGEIYELSFVAVGGTWTRRITTANLTAAAITLNGTGAVWAVTLANKLIVSDGTNTPFAWDGSTGGGLTKLTSCPVLYGRPVVHYAKLMGIKSSDRRVLVWSEENDPTIGYEAGGYNNAWTLTQTSSDPLNVLLASNDGLYYWRNKGIGLVRGAVTTDFQAAGVRDEISTSVGCSSPGGVLEHEGTIFFAGTNGNPYALRGEVEIPLWRQMAMVCDEALPDRSAVVGYGNVVNPSAYHYGFNDGDGGGWRANARHDPAKIRVVYDAVLEMVLFVPLGQTLTSPPPPGDPSPAAGSPDFYCFDPATLELRMVMSVGSSSGPLFTIGAIGEIQAVDGSFPTTPYNTIFFSWDDPAGDYSKVVYHSRDAQFDEMGSGTHYYYPRGWVIYGRRLADNAEGTLHFGTLGVVHGASVVTATDVRLRATMFTSNQQVEPAPAFLNANPDVTGDVAGAEELRHKDFGLDREGRWGTVVLKLEEQDTAYLVAANIELRGTQVVGAVAQEIFVRDRAIVGMR